MGRRSLYVEGFSHKNPIPAGCRIGNMIFSGSILGTDPATGKVAVTLEEQCAFMFASMKRIVEAGGGTTDHIAKITVWMKDRSQRAALNHEWLKMFADETKRPARHTMHAPDLDGGKLIECDFVAVIVEATTYGADHQAYIDAAPERIIWGSDWPHPVSTKQPPNEGELVELLYRFAPDAGMLTRILVDNPAQLFGFE